MAKKENIKIQERKKTELLLNIAKLWARFEYFRDLKIKAIRRKWHFYLFADTMLLAVCTLSLLNIISIKFIRSNELIIILFIILLMVTPSLYVLTRKKKTVSMSSYLDKTIEELEEELDKIEKRVSHQYDRIAKDFVSDIFMACLIFVVLIFVAVFSYTRNSSLESIIDLGFLREEILLIYLAFSLFTFSIGRVLGSPITPKKYFSSTAELKRHVAITFLAHLEISKLKREL